MVRLEFFFFVQVFMNCQKPIMQTKRRRTRVRLAVSLYRQSDVGPPWQVYPPPTTITITTTTITTRLPHCGRPATTQR